MAFAVDLRSQELPLAGSRAGTERWIVCLRDRPFAHRWEVQQIRGMTNAAQRTARIAALQALAAGSQRWVRNVIEANGGFVEDQFWTINALAAEVPVALLPILRADPRVAQLAQVRIRMPGDVDQPKEPDFLVAPPALPIDVSIDARNHNVDAARSILTAAGVSGPASRGSGVRVGIMDTGVDIDADSANAGNQPHPSFVQSGNPNASRIVASLVATNPGAPSINCNNIRTNGSFGPPNGVAYGFRPCLHSGSAGHGTAMAGIACGNDATVGLLTIPGGHAPEASIVDLAVTIPPFNGVSFQPVARWTTDSAMMLNAIQQLTTWILNNGPVQVLNISFDGFSDPLDPVSTAFDQLANDLDVLLVTSAGNAADETMLSNGFYNGLAVGSVHARQPSDPNNGSSISTPFVPMAQTSRGPLSSDPRRFFPDVCATGAGPGTAGITFPIQYPGANGFNNTFVQATSLKMPHIDVLNFCSTTGATAATCFSPLGGIPCDQNTTSVPSGLPIAAGVLRFNMGTSEAAAQVSGAAAIYRAARPAADANETRAALLLNVISPLGASPHTYSHRNTYGVGYVRDDLLAEFAVRSSSFNPLHQRALVNPLATKPSETFSYSGLTPGQRYAVALSWPRMFATPDAFGQTPDDLPFGANLDLEVRDPLAGNALLAQSNSLANNYERLTFICPTGQTTLDLVVRLADTPWLAGFSTTSFFDLVARRFDADFDPGTATADFAPTHGNSGTVQPLSAGAGCTVSSRSLQPLRTVPQTYARAYGSRALDLVPIVAPPPPQTPPLGVGNQSPPKYNGKNINPNVTSGSLNSSIHIVLDGPEVGGPITFGGIAFRTWRPFQGIGPGLTITRIDVGSETGNGGVNGQALQLVPSNTTTVRTSSLTLPNLNPDWIGTSFDEFAVVVPFETDFNYTAGRLHFFIRIATVSPIAPTLFVDATNDGPGFGYGMRSGTVDEFGECPVMALLPSVAPSTVNPMLRVFGSPAIGTTLETQVAGAPPNTATWLFLGTLQPGFAVFGACSQHVTDPIFHQNLTLVTDSIGFVRTGLPIQATSTLVGTTLGLQAVTLTSPIRITNALRLVIGGDL